MTDDDHSTTQTLKRYAPFWGWVRANILTVLPMLAAVIYGWVDLKHTVEDLTKQVEEIAKKPAPKPEVTHSDFEQLANVVYQDHGRWEQVDNAGHRAKH